MAISLIEAIRSGNVTLAKKLLAQRKFSCLNSQTARNDGTALYWACCLGYLELAQSLLEQGANPNILTSWKGSPLHAACDNDQVKLTQLLLRYGANINQQTKSGDTPCHLAAYRGHSFLVQLLVENGASLRITNNKSRTPLEEAQNKGHQDIARYISAVNNIRSESQYSYTRTDWESQITVQHLYASDNGNGFYWAPNSDFSVPPENNLSLLSHNGPSSQMTFRNL
ncbi:ankyrin repeat domain-containing protein 27-like [Saccostrea echinata]|uniref:ankyrin repeat domain-containing protein 27-like n=1 Tax=Saccostrea echinata TaxID=191078 RepID=UPI002A80739A|nr:ankyrin repeat domain-containing protein 27-like [Saccostrea echinata]